MAGDAGGVIGLSLRRDGAELYVGAARSILCNLEDLFDSTGSQAGLRLANLGALAAPLAADGEIGSILASYLGPSARPVRAIAFDKNGESNWALGWHQDRTICVRGRADIAGFGPWTIKQGLTHVQPPFALLNEMVTIRIHLDEVDSENAPLRIAVGSHLCGLIAEYAIADFVAQHHEYHCLAKPGDLWLYATPILHASDRAKTGRRRRVLQVDYCARNLPAGLEWLLP